MGEKMCLAYLNDKKQNEIAKLLGVSSKCASSTKKRYEETDLTFGNQKLATDFNSKTHWVRISKSSFLTTVEAQSLFFWRNLIKKLKNFGVAHMTKGEIFLLDSCLFGPILLLLNQYFSYVIPELIVLCFALIFATIDLLKYCSKITPVTSTFRILTKIFPNFFVFLLFRYKKQHLFLYSVCNAFIIQLFDKSFKIDIFTVDCSKIT
ncbi:cholinephosphotransferase 1 isoform X2 [Brachionus plicatilis]|uniref:Cholinephosphotransferase 1 isoform X2 n=1 Tax=Brachionus plicatilis TaxID=10195 RepID=A0A3M7RRW7_BRAPC|nr:cholinephosphotransferase 1 isoform X2 [Brachionus plicatilis]